VVEPERLRAFMLGARPSSVRGTDEMPASIRLQTPF
jgi:hypothetical protein